MESIIAKVMELQNKENTNIPLYEKQLRDAESGIQNMLNAIQAGILTSSTKERLEQLEETKRELEARIAEEKLAKPKVTEDFIRFWLLRFRKLNMNQKDQRQALVDTFIKGGLAGSAVMNAKAPMMMEGNDKPGFKIDLHIKDLNNVLDCAHSVGAPVPMTAEVQEIFQWLHDHEKGQADHSAIAQYYEYLTGIKIGR